MEREQKVTLENMENIMLKAASDNGCTQLSVNIESTNRAGFCGLGRKSAVNNPKYLRGGWKTIRAGMRRQSHPALTTTKGYIRHGY